MHFVRVNFAGFFGELFHRNQTRQTKPDSSKDTGLQVQRTCATPFESVQGKWPISVVQILGTGNTCWRRS